MSGRMPWIYGLKGWRMDAWMDGRKYRWMNGWMDEWVDGLTESWMSTRVGERWKNRRKEQ